LDFGRTTFLSTLPCQHPGTIIKKTFFFPNYVFKNKIKFLCCSYCSFHVGGVLFTLVLMPFLFWCHYLLLITCWCFYLSHVGGAIHCAFVWLPFPHWCCCSFHVNVVVFVIYMCYCPYHIMLVFSLHWPCCSSHVILLLLSFGVVILLTLVFSFFQHGVVFFALVLRYLLAQPLLLLSSHWCLSTY